MPKHTPLIYLQESIYRLANKQPDKFCKDAVRIIKEGLSLKAVSLYSVAVANKARWLVLRAQSGFDYAKYESFTISQASFIGRCVNENRIITIKNINDQHDFSEKKLLDFYNVQSALIVPLWSKGAFDAARSNGNKDEAVAVLCVYPENDDLNELPAKFEALRESLSLAYVSALNAYYVNFRTEITALIANAKTYAPLQEKINRSIAEKLPALASSCFIYNPQNEHLELECSTTTFKSMTGQQPDAQVLAHYREESNRTARTYRAFKDCKTYSEWGQNGLSLCTYTEDIKGKINGILLIPIRRYGQGKTRMPIGVLRVINRTITHDGRKETVPFSWEDTQLLSFAADIMFVIAHLFQGTETRLRHAERMYHGLKTTLTSAMARLSNLQNSKNIQDALYNWKDDRHNLEDAIFLLNDMQTQLMRISQRGRAAYDQKKIITLTDSNIFKPVVKMIKSMADFMELVPVIERPQNVKLPSIYGNEEAIMSVFRNLIENAFKYKKHKEPIVKIRIGFKKDRNHSYIYFDSWGIGILNAEKAAIFQEGYRGRNATMINPTGTGQGLPQAREVMRQMSGDLTYEPVNGSNAPTRFILTFRNHRAEQ